MSGVSGSILVHTGDKGGLISDLRMVAAPDVHGRYEIDIVINISGALNPATADLTKPRWQRGHRPWAAVGLNCNSERIGPFAWDHRIALALKRPFPLAPGDGVDDVHPLQIGPAALPSCFIQG